MTPLRTVAGRILAVALIASSFAAAPAPFNLDEANAEIARSYAKAHPEVQEFVRHTAKSFGPSGLWLNENALAALSPDEKNARVDYLTKLFTDADYGRHLCEALAEASAIKDERLVAPLMKVAGYHLADRDYDCRPKWIAIAALARQESDEVVPLLVSLVDHGNQNTRFWARAALSRMAHDDFNADKQAWSKWWTDAGHPAIDAELLKPYAPPPTAAKP